MKTAEIIKGNIDKLNILEAFNAETEPEWVYVNKYVINDVLYSLDVEFEEDEEDEEFEEELSLEEESQIINTIGARLEACGYMKTGQDYFSFWEVGYKPTEDIETIIYMKTKTYNKMCIDMHNKYGWMLKALAIDTFYKIETSYKNLDECYQDLYEENYSIIEKMLSTEDFIYSSGLWNIWKKDKLLRFYKENQFTNSWTYEETISKYEELR